MQTQQCGLHDCMRIAALARFVSFRGGVGVQGGGGGGGGRGAMRLHQTRRIYAYPPCSSPENVSLTMSAICHPNVSPWPSSCSTSQPKAHVSHLSAYWPDITTLVDWV